MVYKILQLLKLLLVQYRWRRENRHNMTTAETIFPINKVQVGRNTYGALNIYWMYAGDAKVIIGNYCSIGPKVEFLVGGEHDYRRISTWPFQSKVYKQKTMVKRNENIIVEDDVWIGMEALILSGVKIGRGSIIGARAIVTKDVPPYSIFIGNRVLKRRFSEKIIETVKKIDYSKISHQYGDEYEKYCQTAITETNAEQVLSSFVK